MINVKGQIVLILILIMTVALGIGISIVQRSLSDISTSTKVEESSRAFSAAEAGLEKAIQEDSALSSIPLGNNSLIDNVQKNPAPASNQALEYPRLSKEDIAHVWFASPYDLSDVYTGRNFDIYWGEEGALSRPAVEVTVVYQDTPGGEYKSKKYFYDLDAGFRNNNFSLPDETPSNQPITTSFSSVSRRFFCKKNIDVSAVVPASPTGKLLLLRARLLYNDDRQPFVVRPTGGLSLPVQGRVFIATGRSGVTQRKIQIFRIDNVVPAYFDYAVFSAGDVNK